MKAFVVLAAAAAAAVAAHANPAAHGGAPAESGREAFLKRQAYAEMQRVTGQIDVLQQSHDELAARVARMEGGKGEIGAVKADVAALRAEIDGLRRDMKRMRQEIVDEMTKKVIELVKQNNAAVMANVRQQVAPPPPAPGHGQQGAAPGPRKEYVVQPGDTLSLIAQAFSTTVPKIKEMNGLKNDMIHPGQKLFVPKK